MIANGIKRLRTNRYHIHKHRRQILKIHLKSKLIAMRLFFAEQIHIIGRQNNSDIADSIYIIARRVI